MRNLRVYIVSIAAILQLSLVMVMPASAAEDYYVWVDENGVTNYAERNPEGVRAKYVSKSQTFGRRILEEIEEETPESEKNTTAKKEIDPDALVDEDAAVLAAEMAAIKRKNCEIGKNNLAQLKAFSRIRVTDEKGENRILTEEEKAQRTEEARKVIRENCAG